MSDTLYFRQLLAGRDFAGADSVAAQMVNFVYLIGDRDRGECVVVDPAWSVAELVELAGSDDMRITGALCTHYHQDHVGGEIFGHEIEGLRELLAICDVPVHANRAEVDGIRQVTGIEASSLVGHDGGDTLAVGDVPIELVHTPGHTPGSQCFLVDGRLVAGDTLFIEGCGRVDLPGGDPDEMYRTLTQRLAKLPEDTRLFPGHHYASKTESTLADERRNNQYLRVGSLDDWRRVMGVVQG